MAVPLLSIADIDDMRRTLYGRDAKLIIYKITPTAGETVVRTLANGWHAQREIQQRDNANGQLKIWLSRAGVRNLDHLNIGAIVKIDIGELEQKYSITGIRPMQQAHAGWIVSAEPIENSVN